MRLIILLSFTGALLVGYAVFSWFLCVHRGGKGEVDELKREMDESRKFWDDVMDSGSQDLDRVIEDGVPPYGLMPSYDPYLAAVRREIDHMTEVSL